MNKHCCCNRKEKITLENLISSKKTKFKGIQKGGILNQLKNCDDPTFKDIYKTSFVTPFSLTLKKDPKHGKRSFFVKLDEKYNDGTFHQRLAVGYLVDKNKLEILGTDNERWTLSLSNFDHEEEIILFRERITKTKGNDIFVQYGEAHLV